MNDRVYHMQVSDDSHQIQSVVSHVYGAAAAAAAAAALSTSVCCSGYCLSCPMILQM
jgi:hypothetical protein